jgi:glycosyltransferase involved in cell wall biosynthesis
VTEGLTSTRLPTVSVILPSHDRADWLPRAIQSVLAQTYTDFELIVVDDASRDDTPRVVEAFADARVHYLRLDTNQGPAGARNAGIARAAGRFLAFQDSDDEWLPEKLARQMAVFAAQDDALCVVYCDMERVHADGTSTPFRSPPEVTRRLLDPETRFYQVEGLGIQSSVIRRSCLGTDAPFDVRLPTLEDLDLFLRLSQQHRFHHLRQRLVRYHATPGMTSTAAMRCAGRAAILRLRWPLLIRLHPLFVVRECINVIRCRLREGRT